MLIERAYRVCLCVCLCVILPCVCVCAGREANIRQGPRYIQIGLLARTGGGHRALGEHEVHLRRDSVDLLHLSGVGCDSAAARFITSTFSPTRVGHMCAHTRVCVHICMHHDLSHEAF